MAAAEHEAPGSTPNEDERHELLATGNEICADLAGDARAAYSVWIVEHTGDDTLWALAVEHLCPARADKLEELRRNL